MKLSPKHVKSIISYTNYKLIPFISLQRRPFVDSGTLNVDQLQKMINMTNAILNRGTRNIFF